MANPQRDRFTGISNDILRALARTQLTGYERRVLDVVFLFTYAKLDPSDKSKKLRLKENRIPTADFARLTGLPDREVRRTLARLVHRNIVTCSEAPRGPLAGVYGLQKDYDLWLNLTELPGQLLPAYPVTEPRVCPDNGPRVEAGQPLPGKPVTEPRVSRSLSPGSEESTRSLATMKPVTEPRVTRSLATMKPVTEPRVNGRNPNADAEKIRLRDTERSREIQRDTPLPPESEYLELRGDSERQAALGILAQIAPSGVHGKTATALAKFLEAPELWEQKCEALKRGVTATMADLRKPEHGIGAPAAVALAKASLALVEMRLAETNDDPSPPAPYWAPF